MTDKYDIPYRIEHLPTYGLLVLTLKPKQKAWVQKSTMVAMDRGILQQSTPKEEWYKAIQQSLGKNSFSLEEYSTDKHKAELHLAPILPGSVQHYYVKQKRGLILQSSNFLACSDGVTIDDEFEADKEFFSGKSLFLVKTTGRGDLWFSSYGGMIEVNISRDHIVDTSYIVAFEESLSYQLENHRGLSLRGLAKGFFGGEGKICRFTGQGKLWLQCRSINSLINFVKPFTHTSFKPS